MNAADRPVNGYPAIRPRRLRTTSAVRAMVAQTRLHPADLVLPLFIKEGATSPTGIASMPGVVQHTRDSLRAAVAEAAALGVGGVMLFGIPVHKDAEGSGATDPNGILNVATRDVLSEVGDAVVVMADLCLDEFTDHGHCGLLTADGRVDNDTTLTRYAAMGVALAEAGAHLVGPSGMMDGQVAAVRAGMDAAGHTDVGILAYSAKYASAFYGPFRDAVESSLDGDRRTYQQDPANGREAVREALLDVAEGADLVMVKPAGSYLDLVARVSDVVTVPVAAYQVSGEYAMIEAAAANGWIDRDRAIVESFGLDPSGGGVNRVDLLGIGGCGVAETVLSPRWLTGAEQQVWRDYLDVSRRLNDRLNRQLMADSSLSLAEYEILVQLSECPDRKLRMSDLAELAVHSRSRLTHTVRRLEERGLVERQECTDDRRGIWCVLVDAGFSVLEAAAPGHVDEVRATVFDPLTEDDVRALGIAMGKIKAALGES